MNVETESFLKSLLDRQSLPHALLFLGEDLKLMQQSAYSLIREVFERSGSDNTSLSKIESHNHPDVKEFFPSTKAGYYTIEQVRSFCQDSSLFPHEASKQFFLIHFADRMQDAAANALLKTLEEPSPQSVFILMVQSLENLLPTIVSRTSCVPFSSVDVIEDLPHVKKLNELLSLWPHLTYNDLVTHAEAIQKLIEQEAPVEQSEVTNTQFADQEVFKLFIQIEKWYQQNKFFKGLDMVCEKTFAAAMEDAQIAVSRSMKPAIVLEYLLLNFVS